jgi:hypothetical protein
MDLKFKRTLIMGYMIGDLELKTMSSAYLKYYGGWMFEDGAAK